MNVLLRVSSPISSVEDVTRAQTQPLEATGHPPGPSLHLAQADSLVLHTVHQPVPVPGLFQLRGDQGHQAGDIPGEDKVSGQ